MAQGNSYKSINYGFNQALNVGAPAPIIANRAPATTDVGYPLCTLWDYAANNAVYILSSVVAGVATWQLLESSGGAGIFSSLTVTPGPTSITGTTNINIAGAGVTTIGTGGTGAVNIGNATGNTAVTGSLTASTGLVATAGGITATGTSNINTTGAAVTSINTGGTGALNLGNATGNTAVTGSLTATTYLQGSSLYASGDAGGAGGTTGITNVNVAVAGGSGAFTITSATGSGTATNAGFIKIYVGGTPYYIPYFSATS